MKSTYIESQSVIRDFQPCEDRIFSNNGMLCAKVYVSPYLHDLNQLAIHFAIKYKKFFRQDDMSLNERSCERILERQLGIYFK